MSPDLTTISLYHMICNFLSFHEYVSHVIQLTQHRIELLEMFTHSPKTEQKPVEKLDFLAQAEKRQHAIGI